MFRLVGILLGLVFATSLAAQEVQDCNRAFQAGGAVSPNEMGGKAYANGSVNFVVVHDGRKRASDALFIAVYSPANSDEEKRQCHLIGREAGVGYANINLAHATADYTAADGLTVVVPARIYLPDEDFSNPTMLSINVNQATQAVTVTQELGNE